MDAVTRRIEATQALTQIFADTPALKDTRVTDFLRLSDRAETVAAHMGARKVVLKRYLGPQAKTRMTRAVDAVHEAKSRLSAPNHVMEHVLDIPDQALAIFGRVSGRSFDSVLAHCPAAKRKKMFTAAGRWVADLAAQDCNRGNFSPGHWLTNLPHAPTSATLRAKLDDRAADLSGLPVTRGFIHWDLTPDNLFWNRGAVWGIDLDGARWAPLAADVARFLVKSSYKHPAPSEVPTQFGVSAADWQAILASHVLPDGEAATILPFLIGVEMCRKAAKSPEHPDRLGKMMERAARDLETGPSQTV